MEEQVGMYQYEEVLSASMYPPEQPVNIGQLPVTRQRRK